MPNSTDLTADIDQYATTVNEVEQVTGLDFFYKLDDAIEETIESQCTPTDW